MTGFSVCPRTRTQSQQPWASRPSHCENRKMEPMAALHEAARAGDVKEVRRLLGLGALAHEADGTGHTALHLAASAGHLPVAEVLLKAGAPVDAASPQGMTPLHLASGRGQEAMVRWLVDQGANPAARNLRGHTPVALAEDRGHGDLAAWLAQGVLARGGGLPRPTAPVTARAVDSAAWGTLNGQWEQRAAEEEDRRERENHQLNQRMVSFLVVLSLAEVLGAALQQLVMVQWYWRGFWVFVFAAKPWVLSALWGLGAWWLVRRREVPVKTAVALALAGRLLVGWLGAVAGTRLLWLLVDHTPFLDAPPF